VNDRTRRWRCGLAGPSQRTITAVIASAWLIGAMPAAAQTSPSAASPTISIVASLASSARTPSTKTGWPSATTIRIGGSVIY